MTSPSSPPAATDEVTALRKAVTTLETQYSALKARLDALDARDATLISQQASLNNQQAINTSTLADLVEAHQTVIATVTGLNEKVDMVLTRLERMGDPATQTSSSPNANAGSATPLASSPSLDSSASPLAPSSPVTRKIPGLFLPPTSRPNEKLDMVVNRLDGVVDQVSRNQSSARTSAGRGSPLALSSSVTRKTKRTTR